MNRQSFTIAILIFLSGISAGRARSDIILGDLATSHSYVHRADGGYAMPPTETHAGYSGATSLSTNHFSEFEYYVGESPWGEVLFEHHQAISAIVDTAGLRNSDVLRFSSFSTVRHDMPGLMLAEYATTTQRFTLTETGMYGFLWEAASNLNALEMHIAMRQFPDGQWDDFADIGPGRGSATRMLTADTEYQIYFYSAAHPFGHAPSNGFYTTQAYMYTITPSPGSVLLPLAQGWHLRRRRC